MTLRYVLDTSVFSEPTKLRPNPRILQRLQRHANEVALPSIAWHEARYGVARLKPSRRRVEIEKFLEETWQSGLPILDYDVRAAEWHALERARLERLGRTPPFIDGQIAAVAAVHDLVLVTANARHFSGFEGLRVESWAR